MIQPFFAFNDLGILALRVVLGLILIAHGWPKLKNLKATKEAFVGMGFRPGMFWALMIGIIEFVGGLALFIGFLPQVAAIFVALQFLIIIFTVKRGKKLIDGYEFDLLILVAALLLITAGGGKYGIDEYIGLILY